MATFKLSMLFKYISGAGTPAAFSIPGGFSESVYWDDISPSTITSFKNLCRKRASLLPTRSAIIGIRKQSVDPKGSASTEKVSFPGPNHIEWNADAPQMAVLFSAPASGLANISRRRIAAIPDPQIKYGEYDPEGTFRAFMSLYLTALGGWKMKGRDLTQVIGQVVSVSAGGIVTCTVAPAYAIDQLVTIRSTVKADGTKVSGTFVVQVGTSGDTFTLKNWPHGATTKGTCQRYIAIYPAMVTSGIDQNTFVVVQRKIGRPGLKYVGRRSKRRR